MAYKLYFIGTQLLFLSQIVSSFILLTANMEDVKKIAQKFVSESLAEKISEFVAKATEDIVSNVSNENEENANNIRYLSDENSLRQRKETTKVAETSKQIKREKTTEKYKGQVIDWEKEVKEIILDKFSKEVIATVEKQNKRKRDSDQEDHNESNKVDYYQERADYEQSKIDDTEKIKKQRKQDYEEQKLIYAQQLKQKREQTDRQFDREPKPQQNSVYTDKTQKRKRNKLKQTPNHRQKTTKNTADFTNLYKHMLRQGKSEYKNSKEQNTMATFRGFNIEVTTEKVRTEFDQYDYPKSEFIATSGPVALPRVAMIKPWWEKEMTIPQQFQ